MAVAQLGAMSPWTQNTGADTYTSYKPKPSPKPRQTSAAPRYVRTWSQEEEAFLLEARKSRVPYKDIAARLNKTDLACRLHYHQMVVARKNSPEVGSPEPTPEAYSAPFPYYSRAESLPPISTTISHQSMILPAPIMRDPARSGSGASMLSPNHRRTASNPYGDRRSPMFSPTNGIHKRSPTANGKAGSAVNIDRIQELYRDFAPTFWSNIAAAYSHERPISPSEIESAFWYGQSASRSEPISPSSDGPSTSPASWPSGASTTSTMTSQATNEEPIFSAISSPQSAESNKTRCSVNALLNN